MKSVFEAVIVSRRNPATGEIEYLVLDYEPRTKDGPGEIQLKFPGGRMEAVDKEVGDAAIRELEAETGLRIGRHARHHLKLVYGNSYHGHAQLFFMIEKKYCGGKLNTEDVEEIHSRLSNKRWMPVRELAKPEHKMHKHHQDAFKVAIAKVRPAKVA